MHVYVCLGCISLFYNYLKTAEIIKLAEIIIWEYMKIPGGNKAFWRWGCMVSPIFGFLSNILAHVLIVFMPSYTNLLPFIAEDVFSCLSSWIFLELCGVRGCLFLGVDCFACFPRLFFLRATCNSSLFPFPPCGTPGQSFFLGIPIRLGSGCFSWEIFLFLG